MKLLSIQKYFNKESCSRHVNTSRQPLKPLQFGEMWVYFLIKAFSQLWFFFSGISHFFFVEHDRLKHSFPSKWFCLGTKGHITPSSIKAKTQVCRAAITGHRASDQQGVSSEGQRQSPGEGEEKQEEAAGGLCISFKSNPTLGGEGKAWLTSYPKAPTPLLWKRSPAMRGSPVTSFTHLLQNTLSGNWCHI